MRLETLAKAEDPFADIILLKSLLRAKLCEGKVLEWKYELPFGQAASRRAKLRFVRAVVAFANTVGGFVICGVDPRGNWHGVDCTEAEKWDLATISNLVNSYVSPEINEMEATVIDLDGRSFPVLHVMKSSLMPHLCVKEEVEVGSGNRREVLLAKNAIYCRYGAANDLATPAQMERIVKERSEILRNEILRRVREVEVPSIHSSRRGERQNTIVRVTDDPLAPEVRIERSRRQPTMTVVHERLSENLFDDVNNVIQAGRLMLKGTEGVSVPQHQYYRIYASRQDAQCNDDDVAALCSTALREYYPCAFWFLHLPPIMAARIMGQNLKVLSVVGIRTLFRLILCAGGDEAKQWLLDYLAARWSRNPQPPDIYFTFKRIAESYSDGPIGLAALQLRPSSSLDGPRGRKLSLEQLVSDSEFAESELKNTCLAVSQGENQWRSLCRQLDIIVHSTALSNSLASVVGLLRADNENS